ncbi:hypothetical protein FN846DRAFT_901588 [Sphaerosporella brunnea]|uniref:Uncharacterized protein n=1 Tax=Sphaerosporella brunnea TaxID=1250544 RepID=A0A5J5FBQ7_9PEZI|nr:hypothetical protein FN846DRAFT_901588 [Sphaerosporella brunnea]
MPSLSAAVNLSAQPDFKGQRSPIEEIVEDAGQYCSILSATANLTRLKIARAHASTTPGSTATTLCPAVPKALESSKPSLIFKRRRSVWPVFVKYFSEDSQCNLRTFSYIDLNPFVDEGTLLYGVEGMGPERVGVWPSWERDNREPFYQSVHPRDLKTEVVRWLTARGPAIVSLGFCGHGPSTSGALHMGITDQVAPFLHPSKVVSIIGDYSHSTTFTVHLLSCYSGVWVDTLASSRLPGTAHAASPKPPPRSSQDPAKYRSSLFGSAILASMREGGSVGEHEGRVQDFMRAVKAKVEHTPRLGISPAERYNHSIRDAIHAPLTSFIHLWYIAKDAYRRITDTETPAPPLPSLYSTSPSYAEMKAVIENAGILVQQETGMYAGVRKLLDGHLSAADAANLEPILNKRRKLQYMVVKLAATLAQSRDLILEVLPELVKMEYTGNIMRLRVPCLWLALVFGLAASQGSLTPMDLVQCAMQCNMGNITVGTAIQKQFVPINPIQSTCKLGIFDWHLSITAEELNRFMEGPSGPSLLKLLPAAPDLGAENDLSDQ